MKKKILSFLVIASLLIAVPGNTVMAQDESLDIEKTAIEAIDNSQSVKSFKKQMDDALNECMRAKNAAKTAYTKDNAGSLIQTVVIGPIEAENAYNQFITNNDVNTNSVRLNAYSKYIDLLKANYNANIQKELMDNLEKDYKKAQIQFNNGLITKNDERLIEINYLKAVYQFNSLQRKLNSAYMAVNLLMGEDITKRYTALLDYNIIPSSQIKSLDEYVKDAISSRGEIVNAQNTLNAKKKEFEYGQANFQTDYKSYMQKNQYDIDNSQNSLDETKAKVQIEIINGYKDLENKMKALEIQQASCDSANANYNAAKIQYNNTMITLNEFEDAEAAKAQAQMNLKNAQLDAWLFQIKMNNATGIGPGLN